MRRNRIHLTTVENPTFFLEKKDLIFSPWQLKSEKILISTFFCWQGHSGKQQSSSLQRPAARRQQQRDRDGDFKLCWLVTQMFFLLCELFTSSFALYYCNDCCYREMWHRIYSLLAAVVSAACSTEERHTARGLSAGPGVRTQRQSHLLTLNPQTQSTTKYHTIVSRLAFGENSFLLRRDEGVNPVRRKLWD